MRMHANNPQYYPMQSYSIRGITEIREWQHTATVSHGF